MSAPERPLRIAMTSYYLPSGSKIGVGYQVHELAQELSRRGHQVEMFSACPPVEGRRYAHHQLLQDGSLRTFRWAGALRRLDLSGFDVLHAHGDDYWLWRRRVPVHVRTLHGSCFEEALRIRGAKERTRMVLLGLTEATAGNALGIGLVDFVPAAVAETIDWEKTYVNCLTAGQPGIRRARLPMVLPDEEACIRAALATCGRDAAAPKRVVRIQSTLHLTRCRVSAALLDELAGQ